MRKLRGLDELLVDHMEGELEPSLKRDLDLMMESGDRGVFSALKITKEVIRQTDQPMEFSSLHDKIMAQIEKETIQPRVVAAFTQKRVQARLAIVATIILLAGFSVEIFLKDQSHEQIAKQSTEMDLLLVASADRPDVFADSLMSDQNDVSFLMDAAAQKISKLDNLEAERVLNQFAE